jgi:hypothetical protein
MSIVATLAVGLIPGVNATEPGTETDQSADAGTVESEPVESDTVRLEVVPREE